MSHRFQSGLYDEAFEKDSCGVGLVVNARHPASHSLIQNALQILAKLSHRSALGADGATSDGAGILCLIPDFFFRQELEKILGHDPLPPPGCYAVAQIFVDRQEPEEWRNLFQEKAESLGFQWIAWRQVPAHSPVLGEQARALEPLIFQAFLAVENTFHNPLEQDLKLFQLRRWAESRFRKFPSVRDPLTGLTKTQLYVCSLSRHTIAYKGLMQPRDMAHYFSDLAQENFESQMALVHCRFSTNTLPAWELAQPFRFSSHNGEINTIQGNRNWMKSRQKQIIEALGLEKDWEYGPLLSENRSDSTSFDEALELLLLLGYSPTEAMGSLIPEAWENDSPLSKDLKEFYQFQSRRLEPWDGPAAICFSDGNCVGASLDRNGLRPCRFQVLQDGTLIASSEAGVLDVPPSQILRKGRLSPGQMIVVDLPTGKIDVDHETRLREARQLHYARWNSEELLPPPALPHTLVLPVNVRTLTQYGFHYDEIQQVLLPMFLHHEEATSSMGADTPLAVLSDHPQLLFSYFRQLFAQVTNPPIDPIRERAVMSLKTDLGSRAPLSLRSTDGKKRWTLESPILCQDQMLFLHSCVQNEKSPLKIGILNCRFPYARPSHELAEKIAQLCEQAEELVRSGVEVLIVSDRWADDSHPAIPSLLMISAVHQHLVQKQLRTQTSLVIETGEARDVHQLACLLSFGADAVHPLLIESLIQALITQGDFPENLSLKKAWDNYQEAMNKGLLKILSKLGISTLQSYRGAQTFEILGISKTLVDLYWQGTPSRIGGLTLQTLVEEIERRWRQSRKVPENLHDISWLASRGDLHYRRDGEIHQWNPLAISQLQRSAREKNGKTYLEFSESLRKTESSTLRGHLRFRQSPNAIDLGEVEPARDIVKRFTTGAMSMGALGKEAHETLALAMNQIGAQSNSGEGGEDPARFRTLRNSSIKQIASARFGVTTSYLVHARELQIKMAQGAKPGEGGQLPGHKVDGDIARLRFANPGVTLISPPPHHDIYSIEDLAQLIFDLKNVNPQARISVKLVAKAGVGTIAAGVAKAGADKILVSGDGGGTGASPLSSIRHAGVPWELGLSETHQTLSLNGLRQKVKLETDGQLRTGRDVAIAALLGADEFGFSTAPLIVQGCLMMRKCHLNTCPVGIATQDPALRRKFAGQPEHVINYFFFVAEELRTIMASLGIRTLEEMIGRTDLLEPVKSTHWKARDLDLSDLLSPSVPARNLFSQTESSIVPFDQILLKNQKGILTNGEDSPVIALHNTDRSVGTWLSGRLAQVQSSGDSLTNGLTLNFQGAAGQSFGAFLTSGLTLNLVGEANDYVGKGLSGGEIMIRHDPRFAGSTSNSILVGNTCLYGATSGTAFIAGAAGERFAVRNSGAWAVVEGVGDHGCEYMTGGRVVVLGATGKNFAAGMSGGLAFVWDFQNDFADRCNRSLVELQALGTQDEDWLWSLLQSHHAKTNSSRAREILSLWPKAKDQFKKVIPKETLLQQQNRFQRTQSASLAL